MTIIFSSFIVEEDLTNDVDNDAIVDYCYSGYHNDKDNPFVGGWASGSLPKEHLETNPLAPLAQKIDSVVRVLKRDMNFKENIGHEIRNFWVNIFEPKKNAYMPPSNPHVHNGYFLSCVYYPKVSKNCGNLIFIHPENCVDLTIPKKYLNAPGNITSSRWCVTPKQGTLVVFPSWLMHYVEENRGDEDRISMAFNISLPPIDL
jgi:uncharacterized protein (TIGR02466 family)